MKHLRFILLLTLPLLLLAAGRKKERVVDDFKLLNVDGRMVSLADYPDAKGFVIVFTCNHCPFAKLYPPRFNQFYEKYASQGVPLLAISSTDTAMYEEDTFVRMRAKATAEHFLFPYLCDAQQTVAKNFEAQKTPHAYVIWKEKGRWVVKYNGAFDDNGAHPELVGEPYVANAVDALLSGRRVEVRETASIGCQIYFRDAVMKQKQ
jgi:peroxiredoxin